MTTYQHLRIGEPFPFDPKFPVSAGMYSVMAGDEIVGMISRFRDFKFAVHFEANHERKIIRLLNGYDAPTEAEVMAKFEADFNA